MKPAQTELPRRTLRQRLLGFLLLPLGILLILSLAADYQIAFDPAQEAYDHALTDDAIALASRVHLHGMAMEVDLPAAAEAVLRSDTMDQEFLAVFGPRGELLAGDADLLPEPVQPRQNPRLTDGSLRGHRIRKVTYRMETPQGAVTVVAAETIRKRERTASKILAGMIVPNILLIIATLALVYMGVRSGLKPLDHLGEEIARRSAHDLSPLPKSDVPAEAEPLLRAMDGLIEDLRAAAVAQQGFLANAAHQLKTPLAGLQTQLELATEELPEKYRNRIGNLRDATRRLGHLAHQLLALARSGPEANVAHEHQRVDLAELLQASASAWFDASLEKNLDLGFQADQAIVLGSQWLLREMLANLIDNAIQYTPPGGVVTARCGTGEEGRPWAEVEDSGPGIPADERLRIFTRFYRVPGTAGIGTGLGLAIVKEVADRHGAVVTIADASPAGGTRIRVLFPQLPVRT